MNVRSRLLSLARESRPALAITVGCGLLAGLLTVWQARLLSGTVTGVFLRGRALADVAPLLRALGVVILVRALLACAGEVSASLAALRVKRSLRGRLLDHLLRLGPAYARQERTGELSAVLLEGVESLEAYFSQYLPQLALAVLVPLTILLFVFPLDAISGTLLLLTAPLIPLFMVLIGSETESLTKRQWETLSRMSASFLDSLQGLTTLKLFGRSKAHALAVAEVSEQLRASTLRVLRVTFLSALVLELVATISTAVIAVEVGLRLLYGGMDFGNALFLLILVPDFYLPLRMLGMRFHAGMAGTSAAERAFEILDTAGGAPASPVDAREPSNSGPERFATLELEGLGFAYRLAEGYALKDVSLKIRAGEHIALVGPSGAGKSTLAQLLLQFLQPQEGSILVDGTPLAQIDEERWRSLIAWVPQRPYLFHDTIEANVRLGRTEADMNMVVAATRAACLQGVVDSLPEGYQTVIGEGGARLSSGQAQRLAMARALLRDAPLVILDEPTSSVDPETEALLEEATRRLMSGRTVITIAHRLSTIYQADQIVVMQGGRVVERGTHQELMRHGGTYARMIRAQSPAGKALTAPPRAARIPIEPEEELIAASPRPEEEAAQGRPLPTIVRLLRFLRGSWSWIALSVLLGVLTIGGNIGLMGTSAFLISAAALHPSIAELEVAIVGVRFFGIARGVFRYLERLASHNVTLRTLARLRVWFYRALEPLAPARLMRYRSGDLLARAVADIDLLENFYIRAVAPPVVAVLVSLGMATFLCSYHPILGLALLALLMMAGLLLPLIPQALSRNPGREVVTRYAELHSQLVDSLQGMADLLAYGRGRERRQAIAAASQLHAHAQARLSWIQGLDTGLGVFLTQAGMWVIVVLAIPLVRSAAIPGVLLATLALLTLASFEAVAPLPLSVQMLSSSSQAARRLFAIVDEPAEVLDPAGPLPAPRHLALSVRNLRFFYEPNTRPALDGVSFTLPEGKSLAIVGPSGAGKSTLAQLILRFRDFQEGQVLLGGHDLRSYAQEDVRGKIGVVAQNSYFFNDTIRENLRLARPDAGDQEIVEAARKAQIDHFIADLPKGYDTLVGEQGLRLSSGERQRLAIARALLKNAPILLLDEPTASLDAETERQVLVMLAELMRDRTVLHITHRLVGLERFGEILVLDRGRIVERGREEELLKRSGLYRRLWDLQNRIYEGSGPGANGADA